MENKKKAAQKYFQMSLRNIQNPICLNLGKSLDIGFNPEETKCFKRHGHREMSIKPTKQPSTKRCSPCRNRNPQNQIPSNVRDDGVEFSADDSCAESRSIEQLKDNLKNKKKLVPKYVHLLKKEVEDINTTLREIEIKRSYRAAKTKNKMNKLPSPSKKQILHFHGKECRQIVRETPKKEFVGKGGNTKVFLRNELKRVKSLESLWEKIQAISEPTKAINLSKSRTRRESRMRNNSKSRYEYEQAMGCLKSSHKSIQVKNLTAQLIKNMKVTELLLDFIYNQNEIVESLKKKYIQAAELLYQDQNNTLDVLNRQLSLLIGSHILTKFGVTDACVLHAGENNKCTNESTGNVKNVKENEYVEDNPNCNTHKISRPPEILIFIDNSPLGADVSGTDEKTVEGKQKKEILHSDRDKKDNGASFSNVAANDVNPLNENSDELRKKYNKRNEYKSNTHRPKQDDYVCKTIIKQILRECPPKNEIKSSVSDAPTSMQNILKYIYSMLRTLMPLHNHSHSLNGLGISARDDCGIFRDSKREKTKKISSKSKNVGKKSSEEKKLIENSTLHISPSMTNVRIDVNALIHVLPSKEQPVSVEKGDVPFEGTLGRSDTKLLQSMPSLSKHLSPSKSSPPDFEDTLYSNDDLTNQSMRSDSQARTNSNTFLPFQGGSRNRNDSKEEKPPLKFLPPQSENVPSVLESTLASNLMNETNTVTVKELKSNTNAKRRDSTPPEVKEVCHCSGICKDPKHLKPSEFNYTGLDYHNRNREQFLDKIKNNLKNGTSTNEPIEVELKGNDDFTKRDSTAAKVKEVCHCSGSCKDPNHIKPSDYAGFPSHNKSREQLLDEINDNLKNVESTTESIEVELRSNDDSTKRDSSAPEDKEVCHCSGSCKDPNHLKPSEYTGLPYHNKSREQLLDKIDDNLKTVASITESTAKMEKSVSNEATVSHMYQLEKGTGKIGPRERWAALRELVTNRQFDQSLY